MKYKQNLHMHTTYVDGKDTPEELVIEAIARGFRSVGFSEHSYLRFSSSPNRLTLEKMEQYRKEIKELRNRYRDVIDIFCGLEFDMFSDVPLEGFDYLIGGVHYLDFNGRVQGFDRGFEEVCTYLDVNFGGDGLAFAKKYFQTLSGLPEKGNFDIIGHFDVLTKHNERGNFINVSDREYLNLGFETIHALKGKIPFFEVNTGAIARGYRTSPYPQMEFIKEFKRLGFGAVITSDCHNKNFIDCHFEEAEELLLAAGFRSRWVLTRDGFVEEAL